MTKTLETADHVLKLVLASGVVICYSLKVISGPLATLLFVLACILITSFIGQVVFAKFFRD